MSQELVGGIAALIAVAGMGISSSGKQPKGFNGALDNVKSAPAAKDSPVEVVETKEEDAPAAPETPVEAEAAAEPSAAPAVAVDSDADDVAALNGDTVAADEVAVTVDSVADEVAALNGDTAAAGRGGCDG